MGFQRVPGVFNKEVKDQTRQKTSLLCSVTSSQPLFLFLPQLIDGGSAKSQTLTWPLPRSLVFPLQP